MRIFTNNYVLTMKTETATERRDKILTGLKIAYARMLEFKRQKNSVVVVARDEKIIKIKAIIIST